MTELFRTVEIDTAGKHEVEPPLFRDVLASFPAGVVVVTALGEREQPAGLTVNAFCSVSADPELVLVCVDKGSKTLSAIQQSGMFTINILAAGREQLALKFASKDPDKFTDISWEPPGLPGGGPVLRNDAAAFLACTVDKAVEAGDHWVVIGAAREAGVHEEPMTLIYHRRTFSSLG